MYTCMGVFCTFHNKVESKYMYNETCCILSRIVTSLKRHQVCCIIRCFHCLPHKQVCHAKPTERPRFIRCIYNLLNSSSAAVRYEAAGTLVTLSTSPTAIKVRANFVICLNIH